LQLDLGLRFKRLNISISFEVKNSYLSLKVCV